MLGGKSCPQFKTSKSRKRNADVKVTVQQMFSPDVISWSDRKVKPQMVTEENESSMTAISNANQPTQQHSYETCKACSSKISDTSSSIWLKSLFNSD